VAELRAQKPRKSRQHSVDVLQTLWCLYEEDGSRGTFLGYWVTIIPGQLKGPFAHDDLSALRDYASNSTCLCLGKGWLIWMLPHFSVYLTGFSFCSAMLGSVHFQILCSNDGCNWHVALASNREEKEGRCPQLWIPLIWVSGFCFSLGIRQGAWVQGVGWELPGSDFSQWRAGCVLGNSGGNFTVIVEERSADMLESSIEIEASVKRTEFKVWSVLLARWSPVFERMVGSDNCVESQRAEVVIEDFSACAVEIFLRFLYSGSVRGSIAALVEVAAIADKYQVEALPPLCLRLVRKALTPEVACEVFAIADCFHVAQMRAEALDCIFTNPEEALKERPALRMELLEEILGSGLLCISGDVLKEMLRRWGTDDTDSLASMVNVRTQGEHTSDVLHALWERYIKAGRKGLFVGSWVAVILEPGAAFPRENLEGLASNSLRLTLRKGWLQWRLPHASVHLQGFSFTLGGNISAATFFRIWCSEDGATWHLAYESEKKEIKGGTFLACKRPLGLVTYFKLEVLEGELADFYFNIRGILQTSV
ncbi:bath-42, partial [Symbiodinium sp. CCMP2456]